MKRALRLAVLAAACVAGATLVGDARGTVRIRIGTIVPQGSLWHQTLQYIAQDWRRIVGPDLNIVIQPGGQLGDETELVRKARTGMIDAVGLSSVGLSRIDESVSCLQVPMLLSSYEELDYVREQIASELERRIEGKGFKVLHWADGGWVYLFSRSGATTPDDLRAMRLFTSVGDPETEKLYKEMGFKVVPMAATDLIPQIQTGKLDAFAMPPLFVQVQQLFRLAPNMTNVRWTPLVGGTVITLDAWKRLPATHHDALLQAARKAGERLRPEIRRMGEASVHEMQKRGLKVIEVDARVRALWQKEAESAYPRLRGRACSADVFDKVVRLRDEFRAKAGTKAVP
jgi:TRAP-type C4-dicarboxylate transport system substrate-binding protein